MRCTLVPDSSVLAPELGLPGRFRLVADIERAGVVLADVAPPADAVVRVARSAGAPPPVIDGVAVHVLGDAAGTSGLAAALSAAAALAATL